MVLTPRFNPTAQMIAYMSYIGTKPRVYLFDIETGKQEMLGNFPNMTFSPALLARRQQGGADAGERRQFRHLCDGSAHAARCTRLTTDPAIDTAPSFSPDGTADRVRIRPRRQPADLCDECRRLEPAPHQLRRRATTAPRSGARAAT